MFATSSAFLASGIVAGCTAAHHLSTAPPEPAGLELRWQQPIPTPEGPESVVDAPWLAVGAHAAFVAGPAVGLMSFDLTGDGVLLWSSSHTSSRPPVAIGDVVVTAADTGLAAIRQDRNEVAWRAGLDKAPDGMFAVDTRLAVVTGQELRMFDSRGSQTWQAPLGSPPATAVVFDSGVVFVGLDDGSLVAIDDATGAVQWRFPLEAKPESLGAAGPRVYLSASNGHLYAFDKAGSAKPEWDYAKIRAIGAPVVDARSVYFTLLNNILYAFTPGGGSERWHLSLPNRPVSGPMRIGESVAVALTDGRVIEVQSDGHVRRPAAAPNLPASLTLQSAAATPDRTRVITVTTAQDQKWILMAWGPPKGTRP